MPRSVQHLEIGGRLVPVTNLDKLLYPSVKFSKADLIDYYARVAPYILPHLHERPVTLKRYPNGVFGDFFFEKNAPSFTPDWVETYAVPRRTGGPDIRYILVNDVATLVWLGNLANLEIHPFLHRAPHIDRPESIVFDLDPGEGTDVLDCAEVAFMLKALLDELGLACFPKVSGSKGLQVYVPLNTPNVTYAATQPFAKALAQLLEKRHPKKVVSEMAKHLRPSKIFIDWSQNSDFKTTIGVYSPRAKSAAPYVSMPVDWDELTTAMTARDPKQLYWRADAALERLEDRGDLFAQVLTMRQELPAAVAQHFEASPQPPAASNQLREYSAKRNFKTTPEPPPAVPQRSRQGGRRRFVIQKHAASHLHYDFRLEMHDTLKSWAVPKGPPFALDEQRLAMATEDHPIDYLDFEGVIPKGQYGGGTVMVWDIGTYELIEGNYYKGLLRIHLDGKKLKGEWLLQRKPRDGEARDSWLLIKSGKAMRRLSAKRENASALSGKTLEEIAAAPAATWQSNRADESDTAPTRQKRKTPRLTHLPAASAAFIQPMLAKAAAKLPEGPDWTYEIKLDGYRTVIARSESGAAIYSRNGNDMTERFRKVADACAALAPDTVLDGEMVALDDKGRPSFHAISRRLKQPVYFYAFDLLVFKGRDVRTLPLTDRRQMLEDTALAGLSDPVRLSRSFDVGAADILAAAKQQAIEGVVAKRRTSTYESGDRSGAWIKVKTDLGQEMVVGGYLPGTHVFDSLLAGYYDASGKLIFIAKVKNGFTPALRREIAEHFKGLETTDCPFDNLPEPRNARRGEALTATVMKRCVWLRPDIVVQVEFTERTPNNHLRHSRFAGIRDDKDPRTVVWEQPAELS